MKENELEAINPGLTANSVLKAGQEINVTVPKPFIEVIVDKEVKQEEVIPFTNQIEEDSSLPKGETKEKQAGKNGSRSVTYQISEQNGVTGKKNSPMSKSYHSPLNILWLKEQR